MAGGKLPQNTESSAWRSVMTETGIGGSGRDTQEEGDMYNCGWFLLLYCRNQLNTVKQLSSNWKKKWGWRLALETQRDMCLIWDLNLSLPCLRGWHCCFCNDLPCISPNTWFHRGPGSHTVEALAGCGEQCESYSKKVESLEGLNRIFLNHLWFRKWGNEPSQTLGGLKVGGISVEGNLAVFCKMTNAFIFDPAFPLLGF